MLNNDDYCILVEYYEHSRQNGLGTIYVDYVGGFVDTLGAIAL